VMFRRNQLVIADLKTTRSVWSFNRYLDDVKRHQLSLYKAYYAKKHDIDPTDIDVCFIALEKTPTSKEPIQFLQEHAGIDRMKKSETVVRNTLKLLDEGVFPKNLKSCYDEKTTIACPFYKTEHCINETIQEDR
jgi:hypothetical protein